MSETNPYFLVVHIKGFMDKVTWCQELILNIHRKKKGKGKNKLADKTRMANVDNYSIWQWKYGSLLNLLHFGVTWKSVQSFFLFRYLNSVC